MTISPPPILSTASELAQLLGLTRAKWMVTQLAAHPDGAQSILFYGPEGAGKLGIAKILATAWMCKNPGEFGACGECASCRSSSRAQNPDLLLVRPSGPSSLIRLGAISAGSDDEEESVSIQTFLRTGPLSSKRKVVIIEEADRMNGDAANALLKTLEEPPSYSKLILTSSASGMLLATIVSRCLSIACELPESIEDASPELATFAEGAPGRLNRLGLAPQALKELLAFAQKLPNQPVSNALYIAQQFRDLVDMREKSTKAGTRATTAEMLGFLAIALRTSTQPAGWSEQIAEAHRLVLGNGNAAIVLDALFSRLLSGAVPSRTEAEK